MLLYRKMMNTSRAQNVMTIVDIKCLTSWVDGNRVSNIYT